MAGTVTYFVDRMRVTKPGRKTAEAHPERVYTVNGVFYSTKESEDGTLVPNEKLSIPSKNIDREDILSDGFALNTATGFLTLPEGRRGRTAAVGLSQDEIRAELAALRGETIDPEPEPVASEPEPEQTKRHK